MNRAFLQDADPRASAAAPLPISRMPASSAASSSSSSEGQIKGAAAAIAQLQERLASWEADFAASHNRAPTSADVPVAVKAKYRELAALKKAQNTARPMPREPEEKVVDLKSMAIAAKRRRQDVMPSLGSTEETRRATRPLGPINGNQLPSAFSQSEERRTIAQPRPTRPPQAQASLLRSFTAPPLQRAPIPEPPPVSFQMPHFAGKAEDVVCEDKPATTPQLRETASLIEVPAPLSQVFSLPVDDKPSPASSSDPVSSQPPSSSAAAAAASSSSSSSNNNSSKPRKPREAKAKPNFQRMNLKRQWQPKRKQNNPSAKRRRQKEWVEKRASGDKPERPRHDHRPPDDAVLVATASPSPSSSAAALPMCMHGQPAVERTVKKASTGNKGRTFYACGQPRESQCAFFLWADDCKSALAKQKCPVSSPTTPAFQSMSVAELKAMARKLHGSTSGTKSVLAAKLGELWKEKEAEFASLDRKDVHAVLETVFGHEEFLPGQQSTIEAVLKGKSMLVVQSTGSGKSLMYQLPACVLDGVTLVVCPLVALMQDQLASLPPGLKGACLHSSQSLAEQTEAVRMLKEGHVKVLFVAPERLLTGSFQRLLAQLPVRLVCIDEAHCLSTWSHNFRPAYLRLGSILRSLLPSRPPILALTASATLRVQSEVCNKLGLEVPPRGKAASWLRANLHLKVEKACASPERKIARLLELIKPGESCIVYASMKSETEMLAERLSGAGFSAAAYHAGLTRALRHRVQAEFMCGKISVIVATVAFGMGLDKSDVRKVVHWQAPRSIEDYVQEVGRAGRDGDEAECTVMFDVADCKRLVSLAHGDGVELPQVVRLLQLLLPADRLIGLNLAEVSKELDIKEPVIETLLVGLAERGFIDLLPNGFGSCDVALGDRSDILVEAIKQCGVVVQPGGNVRVQLSDIAQKLALESPSEAVHALCLARDSGRIAQFVMLEPALFARCRSSNIPSEIAQELLNEAVALEQAAVGKLHAMHHAMSLGLENVEAMQAFISAYLEGSATPATATEPLRCVPHQELGDAGKLVVRSDVDKVLRDPLFRGTPGWTRSPRAVARILHGVASPAFSREEWSKRDVWQRHAQVSFADLVALAEESFA